MGVVDKAVSWAVEVAVDDSYYYEWGGWGPYGYDCGHFVITAYEKAGVGVKSAGATYTGDMREAFLKCGFKDVTDSVNLSDGTGLKKGDVLINIKKHAAMMQNDGERTVEARSREYGIVTMKYRNYPWDCALRYSEKSGVKSGAAELKPQRERVIAVPAGLGRAYTYMAWDAITNMDTKQGELIEKAGKKYDADGYGIVGKRFALAMTTTFGEIGDYVDVYMENGRVIQGIIADYKSQDTRGNKPEANKWGHDDGENIVEWITSWRGKDNPPSDGAVIKVVNLGNYFEYPEYAANTEELLYSENAYGDDVSVVWNNRVKENIQPRLQELADIVPTGELLLYAEGNDITRYTGGLVWKNSLNELATTMSFETAKTDAAYLKDLIYTPSVGNIVRMVTNTEVFRGVIVKADDGGKTANKYEAVDLGWYLNKTSQTYQFRSISAENAIRELCEDLNISIDSIPALDKNINQIYFSETVSEILKDILEQCGSGYNFDFTPRGLRIYKIGDLIAYPEFRIAKNIPQAGSVDYMGNVTHTESIENMNNSVKVVSEKDGVYSELKILQTRDMIDKYGFLQKLVKIDPEKENADEAARLELESGDSIEECYSFEIPEKYDSYTRAGEVIDINYVRYVIVSTEHSFKNGQHYNKLEVKRL